MQDKRVRTSCGGLLPPPPRHYRISAGSDSREQTLDIPQGERRTWAKPCSGGGNRGLRGSWGSRTDRRSFIHPVCLPEAERLTDFCKLLCERQYSQRSSLPSTTALQTERVQPKPYLVFCCGCKAAFAGRSEKWRWGRVRPRGPPGRSAHQAIEQRSGSSR